MGAMKVLDLAYGVLEWDGWRLYLAASPQGLSYVGTEERWKEWRYHSACVHDEERIRPYAKQLAEYFRGEREAFTLPLDAHGTPFQQMVWQTLSEIPFGVKASYTEIAQLIGKPSSVRAVGTAIGANPVLIVVPCHRVVGKNGALTGFREGLTMKSRLLELEIPLENRRMSE
jgi:methylated-DNA-[protein]-cysteine S-methyltransferase